LTKRLLIAALGLTLTIPNSYANEPSNQVKHILTYEEPKPIRRVSPKYPVEAAKDGREGWTRLSFVINEQGRVRDVLLLESSGSADLDRESIRAVKKWKYSPAIENGKPVEQCMNSVQMDFKMGGRTTIGARKHFKKQYTIALDYFNQKDYDNMLIALEKLSEIRKRHLSENNYYHLLYADYYKEIGQPDKELLHLNKVATNGDLTDKQAFSVLYRRYNRQLVTNKLTSAIRTYKKLIETEAAQQYLPQLTQSFDSLTKFINEEQEIVVNGDIGTSDFWTHRLLRNQFTLTDIQGNLNKIDVRCSNKRHVYTVENDNSWSLPSSWKNCSIYLYGDDNTTFKVVEHS